MPSSYSVSLRFELQFTGENINSWGDKLNTALAEVDFAVAGLVTKALTGDYALTVANGATDEARASALAFTGTGTFTVTIPSVAKGYDVSNACTGILTITTGSGATVAMRTGETVRIRCDGSNVTRVQPYYYGNIRIQGVGDPTGAQDAATKNYVDTTAFSMAAGALPGQGGNAGTFLSTNGTAASWLAITLGSIGALTTPSPWTATQTFQGGATTLAAVFQNIGEIFMAGGSPAPLATTNFDYLTQATTIYTTAATTNWTLNVRGNSSTALNAVMAAAQLVTVCTVVRQGASPFYNNVFQIDGVTQTPVWIGGAPIAGNATGYDVYTYAIFKLSSATYLILASQTQFK